MNTQFDIVVAGAGISGLLIASELCAKKKVLLIETNDLIHETKYWVTLRSCLELNPELAGCVDSNFKHMDFSDSAQNMVRLTGDYILWDTVGLMNFLKQKILANNGEIRFGQRFCGYKTKTNSIELFVNDQCYTSKLFIDCMGHNSPLILAKDMVAIKGFYLLYGAKLKLNQRVDPICLSNVMLHKTPRYFELFPTARNEAFTTVIYPTKSLTDMKALAADFKFITTKSTYSKYFEGSERTSGLSGVVPVGKVRRKALDKIFFFGESAQSNPAATGTCLTRILFNYKKVAVFLNDKIEKNELSEKSLSASPIILDDFIRKLQLYTFNDILSWNSDRFSKFIRTVDRIDHELINKFIFGDLTAGDIFTKKHLLSLLKPQNFFFAKSLIQSIG